MRRFVASNLRSGNDSIKAEIFQRAGVCGGEGCRINVGKNDKFVVLLETVQS